MAIINRYCPLFLSLNFKKAEFLCERMALRLYITNQCPLITTEDNTVLNVEKRVAENRFLADHVEKRYVRSPRLYGVGERTNLVEAEYLHFQAQQAADQCLLGFNFPIPLDILDVRPLSEGEFQHISSRFAIAQQRIRALRQDVEQAYAGHMDFLRQRLARLADEKKAQLGSLADVKLESFL